MHVPANLLWDIRIPDEIVLAEGDVGPKDDEAKEELTRVMEVGDGDGVLEDPVSVEPQHHDDECREERNYGTCEDVYTKHRVVEVKNKFQRTGQIKAIPS